MARKVVDVTIQDKGRDKGKVFVITEMSFRAGRVLGDARAARACRLQCETFPRASLS